MGKIKAVFYTAILLICLTGCYIVKTTKDGFRETLYCFKDTNTGLDKRLKLKGYYEYTITSTVTYGYKPVIQQKRTAKSRILFYSNGMAINDFVINSNTIKHPTPASYVIQGDTIKILNTTEPSDQTHPLIYTWLKILNDTTLEYLGFSYDKELDAGRMKKFKTSSADEVNGLGTYSNAHFVRYDSITNQDDLWIKKRKWFWCDKEEYKKWKTKKRNNKEEAVSNRGDALK